MSSYVFPPAERTKFLLGLTRSQTIVVGVVIMTITVATALDALWVGALASLPVLFVGLVSWHGRPLRERLSTRLGFWWRLRRRNVAWSAPITGAAGRGSQPACLKGVSLRLAEPREEWAVGEPVGVVQARNNLSIVLPVSGPQMALLGEEETDEHLAAFGDVLSSICGERSERAISRLSWTDVHAAADPRSLMRHHQAAGVSGPATEEYRAHIGKVAGTAADHRVFVAVTVDRSALKVHASRTTTRSASAKDLMTVIVDEGLALARELDQRGFTVGRPLSPLGLSRLIRQLGDPFAPVPLVPTLSERLSLPEKGQEGPEQITAQRLSVSIDGALHRAYQLRWPARPVSGDWLRTLLTAAGGPKFTTVVFEPVPPSRSARRLSTEMARSSSNNEVQARRKGRVTAKGNAQLAALKAREDELVDGHAELDTLAIVVVSARDEAELDERSKALERAAQRCGGARVRPLDTRHDVGWAAALPIGLRVDRSPE